MTVRKFLDPKNDLAFKRIFGSEKNKDILMHFLNDIFGRTTNPIKEVTFLKTIQNPDTMGDRVSSVDILCKDEEGNRFIVEMQVANEPGFEKRAQYYAAKTYIDQREKDSDYKDLKAVIFLAILNFKIFPNKPDYISHHVILDNKTLERDLKDFSFSFIELPKFNRSKHNLETIVDRWCYFFKYAPETQKEDLKEIIGSDWIIERAYDELDAFSWNKEDLLYYNSVEMKNWADKSIKEGIFKEGKAEGKAEGKMEEKKEIARQMLLKGFDTKIIAEITELTESEIDDLRK